MHQFAEAGASKAADLFHQLPDAAAFLGGEVPCAAWFPFDGQLQGGSHHILDMDEGPHGMAAAMELHGLTGAGAQQVRGMMR